jgi:cation diffusion facilitator family transporter
MHPPSAGAAQREKSHAAATSMVAAVGLTSMKLVVGLTTGSLGILAEAAHSALDLVAAFITWVAVRISGRPADASHHYGHGKVENLSALFETLLLLVTCAWIIWEAVARLVTGRLDVQVTVWSYAVMLISIAVDISRSRVLSRVAKKHNSQALEADALHFQTDIWSSLVVIVGLAAVQVGEFRPQWRFLESADAVAALIVAAIVVGVSGRLGWRAVSALLDSAPVGMEQRITAVVEAMPGVENCHNVRVRYSGAQAFIDLHILVDGNTTLFATHALTDRIEEAIQQMIPNADVTVHPEPVEPNHPTGRGTQLPNSRNAPL